MTEQLLESKLELDPKGDIILKQLIQTDEQEPHWLDQNISAVDRHPDTVKIGPMNSEDELLLGVAVVLGVQPIDIRQRLEAGETIFLYQRPENSGQGSS